MTSMNQSTVAPRTTTKTEAKRTRRALPFIASQRNTQLPLALTLADTHSKPAPKLLQGRLFWWLSLTNSTSYQQSPGFSSRCSLRTTLIQLCPLTLVLTSAMPTLRVKSFFIDTFNRVFTPNSLRIRFVVPEGKLRHSTQTTSNHLVPPSYKR